jgi:hypothetical protein
MLSTSLEYVWIMPSIELQDANQHYCNTSPTGLQPAWNPPVNCCNPPAHQQHASNMFTFNLATSLDNALTHLLLNLNRTAAQSSVTATHQLDQPAWNPPESLQPTSHPSATCLEYFHLQQTANKPGLCLPHTCNRTVKEPHHTKQHDWNTTTGTTWLPPVTHNSKYATHQ